MIVLPNELSHQQSEGRLFSSRFILPIFKSSQIEKDPPPAAKAHIMQHYWNRFVADVDKGLCHARLVSESGERDGMGEKRSVGGRRSIDRSRSAFRPLARFCEDWNSEERERGEGRGANEGTNANGESRIANLAAVQMQTDRQTDRHT